MAVVDERTVNSMVEFLNLAAALHADGERPLWYRGCPHPPLPSLLRHPSRKTIQEIMDLERALLARFKQLWVPFQTRILESDFEYAFMMQHFGVPTRLLDWTESPLVGLYFACIEATEGVSGGDAVLWAVDPIAWNHSVRPALNRVLMPEDIAVQGYRPGNPDWEATLDTLPVAMHGTHNSARIVAQKGTFFVFGQGIDDLQSAYVNSGFSDGLVKRIVIPRVQVRSVQESLHSIGVTHATVFPDLEHIALDLKHEFGFGGA